MVPKKTVYKIVSLGSFTQELPDGLTVLNRPCVNVGGDRKKWGDEYLLFQKSHIDKCERIITGKSFFGKFGFDKKKQAKIYMFEMVESEKQPVPDYFILTIKHKLPFNRRYDIVKANSESFSKIFSSAYHKEEGNEICESILLVQNGDVLTVDDKRFVFSAKNEKLLPA